MSKLEIGFCCFLGQQPFFPISMRHLAGITINNRHQWYLRMCVCVIKRGGIKLKYWQHIIGILLYSGPGSAESPRLIHRSVRPFYLCKHTQYTEDVPDRHARMYAKDLRSILPFDWILIELGNRELVVYYANIRRMRIFQILCQFWLTCGVCGRFSFLFCTGWIFLENAIYKSCVSQDYSYENILFENFDISMHFH